MSTMPSRPSLISSLRLRCPYCAKTSLLKKGSWFDFGIGCEACDYRYEREVGYYAGSTWMVSYTVNAVFGISVAGYCALATKLSGLAIATVASVSVVAFGVAFFPFGCALWLYADHLFHPLREADRLSTNGAIRS